MSGQEENRNQKATPFKLAGARKRGETAKSQEVTFVAILSGFVLVLYAMGESISRQCLVMFRAVFTHSGRGDWTIEGVMHWLSALLNATLHVLAPLLLALMLMAILANRAQVGAIFTFHPLKPNFNRLNPVSGFKRMFSMQLIYQAFKSTLKLVVVSLVIWVVLRDLLPLLFGLSYLDPKGYAGLVMGELRPMLVKLLLVSIVIMLIDLIHTKRKFAKDMRMSHREITEEHKQRDGDPRIRNRIRQLRAEFLKKTQSLRSLPDADVLLMNPTHYAVAISYKHGEMKAPKMLAKGAGAMALMMRETARRLHIPVVENPPLARAIYKRTDADQYLPEDLYPQMAKILLWVYAMRDARQQARSA